MRLDRILVVAAHPDDETIGCGALLGRARDVLVVHLTDGVPADERFVPPAWRGDREGYRRARRDEMFRALALARVPAGSIVSLGAIDQEVSSEMAPLARKIADVAGEARPHVVITHPYEGGHPDHDAGAFAARAAMALLRTRGAYCPELVEMTSYHAARGTLTVGSFADDRGEITRFALSEEDERRKDAMLRCFETQRDVLSVFFPPRSEIFRPAPAYDFSKPPHDGALHYERLGWPMTGERWRELRSDAERDLFS